MNDTDRIHDDLLCRLLVDDDARWPELTTTQADAVLERAAHHGVLALLHEALVSRAGHGGCPDAVFERLVSHRRHAVAVSLARQPTLGAMLKILRATGTQPVLLKGEALAHALYSSPELRERCDTDILIPVDQVHIAITALEADGYTLSRPRYKSHQFTAEKAVVGGFPIHVDVHWRITNEPEYARILDHATCLERSSAVTIAGQFCPVLHPVHALLLACVHLGVQPDEQADRLIWLYDIHLLVSRLGEAGLREAADLAMNKGAGDLLARGLYRCRASLGTTIPEAVFARLWSETPLPVSSRFSRSYLGLTLADLVELPGAGQKWQLLRELLFPGQEWLREKYPDARPTWVPLLYLRYLFGGLFKRLTLR